MATWLSLSEAEVNTQLIGICPSATSMCSLYPVQYSRTPLLLGLQPTLQARGNSAIISASVMAPEACRSMRVICSGCLAAPALRCNRRGAFACAGFGAAFSRASIALPSRRMWPTSRSDWVRWMSAACTRWANSASANSLKARENTDSSGTSAALSQPHRRRNRGVVGQTVEQCPRVRKIEDRLGEKGTGHAGTINGRPAAAPIWGHETVQLQRSEEH